MIICLYCVERQNTYDQTALYVELSEYTIAKQSATYVQFTTSTKSISLCYDCLRSTARPVTFKYPEKYALQKPNDSSQLIQERPQSHPNDITTD